MREWILCATVGAVAVLGGLRHLELSIFDKILPLRYILAPIVLRGEVIAVPGGGLTESGEPHQFSINALQGAIERHRQSPGSKILCLSLGTPHIPMPLDAAGFHMGESTQNARWLLENGIAADDVLEETWSLDTIGNAYAMRVLHVDPARWRTVTVVANRFHMPRVEAIFTTVLGLEPQWQGELNFLPVDDIGAEPEVIEARRAREAEQVKSFKEKARQWKTMQDLHNFMFTAHNAYASQRYFKERKPLDPLVLKAYRT